MKKALLLAAAVGALCVGLGACTSTTEEKGYTKDDFAKRPPPPGYGPGGGQASAPPADASNGAGGE